jgi:hypothetical protein
MRSLRIGFATILIGVGLLVSMNFISAQTMLSKPMTAGDLNQSGSPIRELAAKRIHDLNSLTRNQLLSLGSCEGFVDGWLQGIKNALLDTNHGNTNAFTDQFTTSDVIPIFLVYMDKHVELEGASAGLVLFQAVIEHKLKKLSE